LDRKYQLDHKIKLAKEYEAQGKLLHAVQIYEAILNEDFQFIEACISLAEIYERLGNNESAVELLKSFLENDPECKEVRLFFGQFLIRNSRWDEAIEIMSYILPEEEPLISFFLGYSHFMLKEFEIAKHNMLNFISLEKKNDLINEANIYLAKIEIELKNFESALQYAKRAEIFYSNFWELNLIYAISYYNLGMHTHAVIPIEKAIKLNPKEAIAYEWAGKIYLKLGEYLKAEKWFLKYIETIENVSSDVYTKLAEACLKGNKTKAALDYFDIALKLDPGNKFAIEGKKNASSVLNKASDG